MVCYIKFKSAFSYILVFTVLLSANLFVANSSKLTSTSLSQFTVVIDAGHGGVDAGAVSKGGTMERDINLAIAQKLEKMLSSIGIRAILTRTTQDALYNTFTHGHKLKDMKKRIEIINKANPNLVVSIHLNSFNSPTACGAQVFYKPHDDYSAELAENLQELFVKNITSSQQDSKEGDFYILNNSPCTALLVECGFLSNPEEEEKLKTETYQEKIAYVIMCGIVSFWN